MLNAQQVKVGVFDINLMVQALPEELLGLGIAPDAQPQLLPPSKNTLKNKANQPVLYNFSAGWIAQAYGYRITWLNSSLSPSGPSILKYLQPFVQKERNTGASSMI